MDLESELKKRADFFNTQLEKFMQGGSPEKLYDAMRHLPAAGGKRLRPVLSMLTCEAVKGDITKVIPLCIASELTHNFTLVHDDIMDKSKIRRGLPSVHMKYGEPTAIIAGDLLFTKAFESMHKTTVDANTFKNVEYGLIDCVREISEGQQLDMDFEQRKIVSEDEYLEMIRKKTAVFFQYASEAGAILGEATRDQSNALNQYGLNLGLGFQIWDDYLDISSDLETLGKDIGNDIRNGKKTLIACHCLNNAAGEDKKILDDIFGNLKATDEQVKKVYNVFKRTGSIDYSRKKAEEFCNKAKNSLNKLPDTEAKKILTSLVEYATFKREK
jgi:geranylgeranyl diphosphate synthase type I